MTRTTRNLTLLALLVATGVTSYAIWSGRQQLPGTVVRISEEYANINTDLSGETLAAHGITDKTRFTVRYGTETIEVMLGTAYGDVPKGEWIGLIEEDGTLQIAICYGHAATVLGCKVGDVLHIVPPH